MAMCELKVTVFGFHLGGLKLQKCRLGGLGFAAGAQLFVVGWWINYYRKEVHVLEILIYQKSC